MAPTHWVMNAMMSKRKARPLRWPGFLFLHFPMMRGYHYLWCTSTRVAITGRRTSSFQACCPPYSDVTTTKQDGRSFSGPFFSAAVRACLYVPGGKSSGRAPAPVLCRTHRLTAVPVVPAARAWLAGVEIKRSSVVGIWRMPVSRTPAACSYSGLAYCSLCGDGVVVTRRRTIFSRSSRATSSDDSLSSACVCSDPMCMSFDKLMDGLLLFRQQLANVQNVPVRTG